MSCTAAWARLFCSLDFTVQLSPDYLAKLLLDGCLQYFVRWSGTMWSIGRYWQLSSTPGEFVLKDFKATSGACLLELVLPSRKDLQARMEKKLSQLVSVLYCSITNSVLTKVCCHCIMEMWDPWVCSNVFLKSRTPESHLAYLGLFLYACSLDVHFVHNYLVAWQ